MTGIFVVGLGGTGGLLVPKLAHILQKWLVFSIKKYTQEEALDIFEQEYGYRPKENKVKVEKVRFYRRHEQLDIEEFPNGAYIFTDDCERGSFGTWCIEINR